MASRSSGMSRQEAGRKRAEARWSKTTSKTGRGQSGRGNQSRMSRQEAGHRGGKAVSEEYGPEFYREIGRKGGHAHWREGEEGENYEHEGHRGGSHAQHQRAGHKGGEATASRYSSEFYREIGRKGGHAHRGSKQYD